MRDLETSADACGEKEAENNVTNIVKLVSEILQRTRVLSFTQSSFKFRKSYSSSSEVGGYEELLPNDTFLCFVQLK